jgi:hypothetical protein
MTWMPRIPALAALFFALVLGACADDPSGPNPDQLAMQQLAGSYAATDQYGAITLTTTANGETRDWIAAGGSLQIDLAPDGTTTGRLFVPGADDDGGDLDADLTGTWAVDGNTISFSHTADTFLRDMPFQVNGSQLEGDQTFDDVRVQAVFVKQ